MRNSTLIGIFLLIWFVPVYFSRELLAFGGLQYPMQESRGIVGLVALIIALIVLAVLALLNRRILAWRKARGRDIEEEQRYESDYGMISLKDRDKDQAN